MGLQYLEQRYYDPQVGRFISQDPVGLGDYRYCENDPVNAVDPSGLYSFAEWKSDFAAGLEEIRHFNYDNRFALGAISGIGATVLAGNPYAGAVWGGYITYQNSVNGTGDHVLALVDGALVGTGVYELTGYAGQASAAYQYHFGSFEESGVGCGSAGPAMSGSKGGEASSEEEGFIVRRYMSSSQYKAARKIGLAFDPQRGSGIPTTSAKRDPVDPEHIREMTGAQSASLGGTRSWLDGNAEFGKRRRTDRG